MISVYQNITMSLPWGWRGLEISLTSRGRPSYGTELAAVQSVIFVDLHLKPEEGSGKTCTQLSPDAVISCPGSSTGIPIWVVYAHEPNLNEMFPCHYLRSFSVST